MSRDQVWCPVCLEFHPHVRQDEFDELMAASSKLGSALNALKNIAKSNTDPWQCAWHALDTLSPGWAEGEREQAALVMQRTAFTPEERERRELKCRGGCGRVAMLTTQTESWGCQECHERGAA